MLWEFVWESSWVKMASHPYGYARLHKHALRLPDWAPRVLLTCSAAVLPQVQDQLCQQWQEAAASKCSSEPMPFSRNHLLLWHGPACANTSAPECAGEGGTEQGEEQTNQESSCGGMLVPWTWRVFRCWFPGPGGGGENGKGSEGLYSPSPHCRPHHWPVPVFPACSLAFCYKQAQNHLLLKEREGQNYQIKNISKAELLIKSSPLWVQRWI